MAVTLPHETKALAWRDAKLRGERLPEHELPGDGCCDLCSAACGSDDFNPAAGLFICPVCLEDMIYAHDAN